MRLASLMLILIPVQGHNAGYLPKWSRNLSLLQTPAEQVDVVVKFSTYIREALGQRLCLDTANLTEILRDFTSSLRKKNPEQYFEQTMGTSFQLFSNSSFISRHTTSRQYIYIYQIMTGSLNKPQNKRIEFCISLVKRSTTRHSVKPVQTDRHFCPVSLRSFLKLSFLYAPKRRKGLVSLQIY